MPSLYIILGAAGSGRREILLNLVETINQDKPSTVALFINRSEPSSPLDKRLHLPPKHHCLAWEFQGNSKIISDSIPSSTSEVFFLTEGQTNPVDQIEDLKSWIMQNNLDLARIIVVVNCQLCYHQPAARAWFQCCIHFADIVLLNTRSDVPNQWVKEFLDSYKKDRYPCLFHYVKKGKVNLPEIVLFPEARRLSLIFDDLEADPFPSDIEIEGDLHLDKENNVSNLDSDLYLARYPNGRRVKRIPDIRSLLKPKS